MTLPAMRVSHILAIQPIDDGLRALRRAHTDATAYAALVEKARYRYRALHCLLDAPVGFQKPMPPPATYASELVENNGVPGRTRSANDFQRSPDESGLTNPGIN